MATAVYDRLFIPLWKIKRHLKLDDETFVSTTALVNSGDINLPIDSVIGINKGEVFELDEVIYTINAVDRVNNVLELDKPLVASYPQDYEISWHPDEVLLLEYFDAAKEEIDRFLRGQCFLDADGNEDAIPSKIATHALRWTAYYYEVNVLGTKKESAGNRNQVEYMEQPNNDDIWRWRIVRGF